MAVCKSLQEARCEVEVFIYKLAYEEKDSPCILVLKAHILSWVFFFVFVKLLHARLDGRGAEDGSEHGDDELNNGFPSVFFHSFKF